MLKIFLPKAEMYDEDRECFINVEECEVRLEHSLRSISKWESFYEKPFLNTELSMDEMNYYIKCMSIDEELSDDIVNRFGSEEYRLVKQYIDKPSTATTIYDNNGKSGKNTIITSEVIYYWMIAMEIPFECDSWHINRLLMLIRVCGAKNNPKKMGKKDIMMSNHQLNKLRKARLGTMG